MPSLHTQMMRSALILLAIVGLAAAEKPVFSGNPAPATQTGGSTGGGGPSTNERWDENGGGKWRATLYYEDTARARIRNDSSGKKEG